ncbi:MAG TPA: monofunctional biosynthetic peptidoglycan transglycosylase [Rikenellaceae bacterium]|jgi:monofunctional biosynthetic peptidoglycan transglycosylase|nr:monofunctional biosynthetic peptidoglycan transglycosylase [Rikenellaceae bacterium]
MIRKIFRFLLWVGAGLFALSILLVILYRFVPVPVTPLMIIRFAEQRKKDQKATIYHHWVPLEKISGNLKRAVVASEDQRFFEHRGFDHEQIKKARKENITRRRPRGASTISQQTAKNLFLWPRSSWFRKGLEAYFTFLIELLWSKERILEVYLNSIEMGKGIYGAEAVARLHFDTTPLKLTRSQAALVAATLPNPRRFSSRYPSAYILRRQQEILRQMNFIAFPAHLE